MQPRRPCDHRFSRRSGPALLATVRGRLAVLTGGRRGTPEDAFAVGAAVLLDAALDGAVAVEGRKRLGRDRRRVVSPPASSDHPAAPLIADVRRRVRAGSGDTPWGWCERLAVFAEDALAAEAAAAGLVRAAPVPAWRRLARHRTLDAVDRACADQVQAGLVAVASGTPQTPADIALAAALHGCDVVEGILPGRDARRLGSALEDATRTLPGAARAIGEALLDRRRRVDRIGTWYADD